MPLPNDGIMRGRYPIGATGRVGLGGEYVSVCGPAGAAFGSGVSSSHFVSRAGFGETDMMNMQRLNCVWIVTLQSSGRRHRGHFGVPRGVAGGES
jgi:hypothetical protein